MISLPSDKIILFLGDSITQDGRYISFIHYYLHLYYPNENFNIISLGLGGETVSGLPDIEHHEGRWKNVHQRLEQVLNKVKPDVVVSCYGMNDGIYLPFDKERFKAFKEGYRKLIKIVSKCSESLILITPPFFDPKPIRDQLVAQKAKPYSVENPYPNYDDVLSHYSDWLITCQQKNVFTLDLHQHLLDYVAYAQKNNTLIILSPDGIHPDAFGHFLMARYILINLGRPIPHSSNSLENEFNKITSTALFKLIGKKRFLNCSLWWDRVGYLEERPLEYPSSDDLEKDIMVCDKKLND